jgi:membrane-associated protease RseP (regulator of RpoE activity)
MMLLAGLAILAAHAQDRTEVPFRLGDNAIIVDAVLNGRKLSLMFDSGFGGTVLADDNIDIGPSDGMQTLRDFVGEFQAKQVKIKSFKLGDQDIHFAEQDAIQQPTGHLTMSYNSHTDGILGFQAIESRVTEINFEKKEFIFYPSSYDISKFVPDNKRTFLLKMLPLGINAVVLPVVAPNGRKLVMSLDTGNAFYATTHRDVLDRVGLWDDSKQPKFMSQTAVASGPVDTWQKELQGMTVFGVPVATGYWDIIDLPSSSAEGDGTVGIQFLKNFNVTIDYERRRVWLDNFTGQAQNEPEGQIGIIARADHQDNNITILRVMPESPAANAGIKEGDHLLEIDGSEVSSAIGFRQLDARLKGKVGTKIALAISRDGNVVRYNLDRIAMYN